MSHRIEVQFKGNTVICHVSISRGWPGHSSGPPDTWAPAEPDELQWDAIPPGITDDELPDLEDRVWAALEAEDDGPDQDEAYERWRDD